MTHLTYCLHTAVKGHCPIDGRSWNHNFSGRTAIFPMLAPITEAAADTANTVRGFSDIDARGPVSIKQINTVTNTGQNTKTLYAEFSYDTQGRAIYSSLANGVEAVSVNYVDDLTVTVTNVLGKDATYTFALIDGVKKLKKVVGEPTSKCLRREVRYIYNIKGSVFEKIQNNSLHPMRQQESRV